MESHWVLVLALLSTGGCGNGNAPQTVQGQNPGGTETAGGTENQGGPETTGGTENQGGAQNTAGIEATGGTENKGGAENAGAAEATGGAAQVEELANGPGVADTSFETSPLFLTRMHRAMTGLPSSPHGIVQIFYSVNIEPILTRESFSALPAGTMALKKQDRDGDGTVDQIMVMVKDPAGTMPSYGDWSFEQHDPVTFDLVASSVTNAGFGDFCAGCHRDYSATDWLAGTSLSN